MQRQRDSSSLPEKPLPLKSRGCSAEIVWSKRDRCGAALRAIFSAALREASATGPRLRRAATLYRAEIVNPPLGAERMNFSIWERVIDVTFPSAESVTLYEDHPPMAAVTAM